MDRHRLIRKIVGALLLVAIALPLVGLGALRLSGWRPLVEQTGSMAPKLTPGDLLLAETVSAGSVRAGDVITFAHPSGTGARSLTASSARSRSVRAA